MVGSFILFALCDTIGVKEELYRTYVLYNSIQIKYKAGIFFLSALKIVIM
jgi:hypothetical protein